MARSSAISPLGLSPLFLGECGWVPFSPACMSHGALARFAHRPDSRQYGRSKSRASGSLKIPLVS